MNILITVTGWLLLGILTMLIACDWDFDRVKKDKMTFAIGSSLGALIFVIWILDLILNLGKNKHGN